VATKCGLWAVGQTDVYDLRPSSIRLSLIARSAVDELLPWCAAHGTGVLCYSPMQSGLLTGSFSRQRAAGLPSDDWRRRAPRRTPPPAPHRHPGSRGHDGGGLPAGHDRDPVAG
jgi:aryl-alcohol dehydrogenase-like predicted oxidoreductase